MGENLVCKLLSILTFMRAKINIIFGATASGKTAYGVELAKRFDGEIINADSMQVYREIPVIGAQPTAEERQDIPHHLYGFRSVLDAYSVGDFIIDATRKINEVSARGKMPILVGGTGLYIKALVEGLPDLPTISSETKAKVAELRERLDTPELHEYLRKLDPMTASKLKPNDMQRIMRALEVMFESGHSLAELQKHEKHAPFPRSDYYIIWLNPTREVIYQKINQRFIKMIELGAVKEVKQLITIFGDAPLPKACGIPEIQSYLEGKLTLDETICKAQQSTRHYAKRQITWGRHQFDFNEIIANTKTHKKI